MTRIRERNEHEPLSDAPKLEPREGLMQAFVSRMPREEFVESLTDRVTQRREARTVRPLLAACLTAVTVGTFGVFGGLGYAKKAVEQAIGTNTPAAKSPGKASAPGGPAVSAAGNAVGHGSNGNGGGSNNHGSNGHGSGSGGHGPSGHGLNGASGAGQLILPATKPAPSQYAYGHAYGHKVTICHRTHSHRRPFVLITVSGRALPAHRGHGDTLPGPGGVCPGPPIPLTSGG